MVTFSPYRSLHTSPSYLFWQKKKGTKCSRFHWKCLTAFSNQQLGPSNFRLMEPQILVTLQVQPWFTIKRTILMRQLLLPIQITLPQGFPCRETGNWTRASTTFGCRWPLTEHRN